MDVRGRPTRREEIARKLILSHSAFKAGEVHCMTCGKEQRVNAKKCMRSGWPTCCGATMQLGRKVTP